MKRLVSFLVGVVLLLGAVTGSAASEPNRKDSSSAIQSQETAAFTTGSSRAGGVSAQVVQTCSFSVGVGKSTGTYPGVYSETTLLSDCPIGTTVSGTITKYNQANQQIGQTTFSLKKGTKNLFSWTVDLPDYSLSGTYSAVWSNLRGVFPDGGVSTYQNMTKQLQVYPQFSTRAVLNDHYSRHGADYSATSPRHYAETVYLVTMMQATEVQVRSNLDTCYWHGPTGTFAVKSYAGYIRTGFKPTNGYSYWLNESGCFGGSSPDSVGEVELR